MRKIWNTLLYGERRTKAYLWSILLLIVFAVVSCVFFIITLNIWWVFGILGGLIAAAIIASSIKFREIQSEDTGEMIFADEHLNPKTKETKSVTGKSAVTERKNESASTDEEQDSEETQEENERYIKLLHKKQIKKLLYKYKVKRVHYPVLIETCESRKIRQCPGYVWVNKGKLQVLVLTAKTRVFELSCSGLHTILVERAVRAKPKEEYVSVKNAKYISKVFEPLIPSYYIMEDENGRRTYRKNSYLIGEDLVVTDRSARALMELTQARFVLPEEEKMMRAYGTYATEAYKLKFLCQDGVILPEEYKDKIRVLLQQMVEAQITDYEFSKNLSLMVKKQLITEDYAKYYEDARLGR